MTAARRLQRFDALSFAESLLARPPAEPWITRPEPHGEIVARFVLPLELCQPQNRTRHGQSWQLGKLKRDVYLCLLAQNGPQRAPLPGRPQVLCLRLSSGPCDAYADWAKHAIDALCVPKGRRTHGLGYLRDDGPRDIDLQQWWEPAKRGEGFCYIEIRTGVAA
jgi:hypothetical protein